MSRDFAAIFEQLGEPERAVVWIPASYAAEDWDALKADLSRRGYHVLDLDARLAATGHDSLMKAFASAGQFPDWFGHNLNALKDCLAGLPAKGKQGWVVLFRNPRELRKSDAATWDALREIVDLVHELKSVAGEGGLRLLTPRVRG